MVLFLSNLYYNNYNARTAQINSFKLILLWQRGSTQNTWLHPVQKLSVLPNLLHILTSVSSVS